MNIKQAKALKVGDTVQHPNESNSKGKTPWLKGAVKQGAGALPESYTHNGKPYVLITIGVSVWPSTRLRGVE